MTSGTHTLLLNADFVPYKVITWRRAMELILDERADLVEQYAERFIHSVNTTFPWPAVLRLRRFVKPKARLRFNRINVLARDDYTCAYCGAKPRKPDGRPRLEDLTLDHVIPRAQSRNGKVKAHKSVGVGEIPVTTWLNVVTACGGSATACNMRKADRTPEQAGMRLLFAPRVPSMVDVLRMSLRKIDVVPQEWISWLPEGAREWAHYWEADLSEEEE